MPPLLQEWSVCGNLQSTIYRSDSKQETRLCLKIRDKGAQTSAVPLLFRRGAGARGRGIGREPAQPTAPVGFGVLLRGDTGGACLLPCTFRQFSVGGVLADLSSSWHCVST